MASAMLLVSCADEEFVGDKSLLDTSDSDAITLNMKTPAVKADGKVMYQGLSTTSTRSMLPVGKQSMIPTKL